MAQRVLRSAEVVGRIDGRTVFVALLCGQGAACSNDLRARADAALIDGSADGDAGPAVTPLACPSPRGAIELGAGRYAFQADCTVTGINLHGDAAVLSGGIHLTVDGDILLSDNASLAISGGSFTLANHTVFEHRIEARGNAVLDIAGTAASTNAGVAGNLSSSYDGYDNSLLRVDKVAFDFTVSWLLANLHDRARVETKNSAHFPSEAYPADHATLRIEGASSDTGVWLLFAPGSLGVLDNLPSTSPFDFSFGRSTPGVTGIDYQVDVVQGNAGFGIFSLPRSNVTLRNNVQPVGLDYVFYDVTTPTLLSGLQGGLHTQTYQDQGRTLVLDHATLPPIGWQVYNFSPSVALANVVPVTITNSLLNELGALDHGAFEVQDSHFGFALLAAMRPGSSIAVRRAVINSQSILAQSNGLIRIEDSEIHGSLVQASDSSRVLMVNTRLLTNQCHPECLPTCLSLDGSPPTRCNPFNPSTDIQFVVHDQAAVLAAGIDEVTTIPAGSSYSFTGSAFAVTATPENSTYSLRYRSASQSSFTDLVVGAAAALRAQPLGRLDTSGLSPGGFVVELELHVPGEPGLLAQRTFMIR